MKISWFLDFNILKMRSEDTLLEKWCISLPFHSAALASKADHEAAEHFVCHRGPSTKDSGYLCMLIDSYVYSYFEKGCRRKCARDNPER